MIIVAHKGAVAVLIDGGGNPVSSYDHIQQLEIADGVFLGSEEGSQDGSRRVVDGVVEATRLELVAEPGMRAAVPLHHQPHLRATETPTPVLRRSSPPFRFDSRFPQPLTNRFPADLESFTFLEHLDEVGVVEQPISLPMKPENQISRLRSDGVSSRSSPTSMDEPFRAFPPIPDQQTLGMAITDPHQLSPALQRQAPPQHLLKNLHPLNLTHTHPDRLLHARLPGDILAWLLKGTFMLGYHSA
jgi:hypothetical protein